MLKYDIPTTAYENFDLWNAQSLELAKGYVRSVGHKVVIKASDLAVAKGVVLPASEEEACQAVMSFACGEFGEAGTSVVIEEYLEGDEISVLTFSDGETFKSRPPGQGHIICAGNDAKDISEAISKDT